MAWQRLKTKELTVNCEHGEIHVELTDDECRCFQWLEDRPLTADELRQIADLMDQL